jgi:glycosyltransferase involved in cell wall biosynthesis
MRICYYFSHIVWYREVYMKAVLEEMGIRNLYFIHNAVAFPDDSGTPGFHERAIDFLWVNRLTPERRSDWVTDILGYKEFRQTHNVMAGFLSETLYQSEQDYVKNHHPGNLDMMPFVNDPSHLYRNARFFVLPAEFVFANNALLEAMSYGVVPLIVRKPGYDLLVQDQQTGFVSDYTKDGFAAIMEKARQLNQEQWQTLSDAAKRHVRKQFSPVEHKTRLEALYQKIEY